MSTEQEHGQRSGAVIAADAVNAGATMFKQGVEVGATLYADGIVKGATMARDLADNCDTLDDFLQKIRKVTDA